jgi:hypothetical protein
MKTWRILALFMTGVAMAEANESATLVSKALEEAQTKRVQQDSATDAQISPSGEIVEGVLTLDDPHPGAVKRSYKWILGAKVQNFKMSGTMANDYVVADLNGYSAFSLPSLEFGVRFERSSTWHWGMIAHAGYASQKAASDFYSKSDSYLNTLLTDLALTGSYQINSVFGLEASLGVGMVTYTQTGSKVLEQFSAEAPFRFASAGTSAWLPFDWQAFVTLTSRNLLREDSTVALPKESVELGTRYVW